MTITISKFKFAMSVLALVLLGGGVAYAGINDNPFVDVPDVGASDEAFYSEPVEWLWDNGLTTGTSATTFEPMRSVTRGEYATFNYRYDQNIVQPALEEIEENVATVASDLANSTRVYFARVDADGTVAKTSHDAISVEHSGSDGEYTVTLPESAANCVVQTGLSMNGEGLDLLVGLGYINHSTTFSLHDEAGPADEVSVYTVFNEPFELVDMPFTITAYCSGSFLTWLPGIIIDPIIILP
ncbi:MAG: S-layer homology domain-containing protein [Acidimicrobiales bacterium]|nr:S-layer homology domain-containing protein [Acidimicrobiales bacterium]MDG1877411.1 S-layer homology domain-containing protein [Acidimicrobiales bacterium]